MRNKAACCALWIAIGTLCLATPAQAERALLSSQAVEAKKTPAGAIFDACGIAFRGGQIYVSDYYHHSIEVFAANNGEYKSQVPFPSDSRGCAPAPSRPPKPSTSTTGTRE